MPRAVADFMPAVSGPQDFQSKARREGAIGTLVRGGLWEVDLLLRLMSPCYWPEVGAAAAPAPCSHHSAPQAAAAHRPRGGGL